jgi:hypothetical protein
MLSNTIYSINLSPEEGRCSLQVRLTKDIGNVELTLFTRNKDGSMSEKTKMTFTSDVDLQALIETLRRARVASLKHKGFKVVM